MRTRLGVSVRAKSSLLWEWRAVSVQRLKGRQAATGENPMDAHAVTAAAIVDEVAAVQELINQRDGHARPVALARVTTWLIAATG